MGRRSVALASTALAMMLAACSDSERIALTQATQFDGGGDTSKEPAWAVPYQVGEFWHEAKAGSTSALDVEHVIDRVSHAFDTAKGSITIEDPRYSTRLDRAGLELTSKAPDGNDRAKSITATIRPSFVNGVTRVAASPRSAFVLGNVAQVDRDGVLEHYSASSRGVELAWVLRERPQGDVTFGIDVTGLGAVVQTGTGLHYHDADGNSRLRIGTATFVDQDGRRTALATRVTPSGFEITVPGEVAQSASYPAVIDPVLSPEFGIDQGVLSSATGQQLNPTSAYSGSTLNQALLVWEDYRFGSNAVVMGTRVGGQGSNFVGDPFGIRISNTAGSSTHPSVTSDGTSFLVAWQQETSGNKDVLAARLSPIPPVILDPTAIAVANGSAEESHPSATYDGSSFLVVWQEDNGSNYDIRARRVSSGGSVVDSTAIGIATTSANETDPSAAGSSSQSFVVWTSDANNGDVRAQRVASGATTGSAINLSTSSAAETHARVAANSTDALVVWQTNASGNLQIASVEIRYNGATQYPSNLASGATVEQNPTVGAISNGFFLAVWEEPGSTNRIKSVRFSNAGVPYATSYLDQVSSTTLALRHPSVSCMSSSAAALIAWESDNGSDTDIRGRLTDSAGILIGGTTEMLFSSVSTRKVSPSIASNGSQYAVLWEDYRAGNADIYGARIGLDGSIVDYAGKSLAGC